LSQRDPRGGEPADDQAFHLVIVVVGVDPVTFRSSELFAATGQSNQ
jgi:hypothetical protein